jgi:cbb3-type cytochrome oxidase subunit 3
VLTFFLSLNFYLLVFCVHRPRQRLLDKPAREIELQQAMWVSLPKQRTPSIVSAAASVFIEGQHAQTTPAAERQRP